MYHRQTKIVLYKYLSENHFRIFKKHLPLSCVDIILLNVNNEFLLVRRSISPYMGKWCLPGGIIRYREKMEKAVYRIVKEELGIKVNSLKYVGCFEKIYPKRHDISNCFVAHTRSHNIKLNYQASKVSFFPKIPTNIAAFHKIMIKKYQKDRKKLPRHKN